MGAVDGSEAVRWAGDWWWMAGIMALGVAMAWVLYRARPPD